MTFLEITKTFLFGLVQGFSEFLPISSSGHLVLLRSFLEMDSFSLFFILVLHLGTLAAILSHYKKDLSEILKNFFLKPFCLSGSGRVVYLLITATSPGILGGLLLVPLIKKSLLQTYWTGVGFILTATCLFLTRNILQGKKAESISFNTTNWSSFSFFTAFLIGLAQVLAFFPGMSRSGWTITTALFLGRSPHEAVLFCFLLAIPAILGGLSFELLNNPFPENFPFIILILAFFSSWFFGWVALKWLVHSLKNLLFPFFAFYLWPLGIFTIFFT